MTRALPNDYRSIRRMAMLANGLWWGCGFHFWHSRCRLNLNQYTQMQHTVWHEQCEQIDWTVKVSKRNESMWNEWSIVCATTTVAPKISGVYPSVSVTAYRTIIMVYSNVAIHMNVIRTCKLTWSHFQGRLIVPYMRSNVHLSCTMYRTTVKWILIHG